MRIGALIEAFRVINRIEQKAMAEEIGLSPSTLSRIEKGQDVQGESVVKVMSWAMATDAQAPQLQLEGPKS